MISSTGIHNKVKEIKNMTLCKLFEFGRKTYIDIKIYDEKKYDIISELESDRNYVNEIYINEVVNAIMEKKYGITEHIEINHAYRFATFYEYLDQCVSYYFIRSMQKDNAFCRKVVTHYLFNYNFGHKNDIDKEVDKWIDYHNSAEFKNNIMCDVFSLNNYLMNLANMVNNCFNDEKANKYVWRR